MQYVNLQYGQQRAQELRQEAAQAKRVREARPARQPRPRFNLRDLFRRLRPA
ncbi:hypothetical protein [Deinococcus arenicola]|uniref:Uncharacterized protein n=1 Tax=Deinococcus arenicola TaxID=2994950 RepID=A0ABU4DNJ8_9DEIO|nr:hypothetical protein [Deinococcus sp. ZS9-10]MDV6374007.1 hypothetical protein [Deinococcus sp. ZS9-10]